MRGIRVDVFETRVFAVGNGGGNDRRKEIKVTKKNARVDKNAGVCYNELIMNAKGKFIVFEGTDGSGKSTQMKLLGKYLASKGVNVFLTCEPTDSPFGAQLRSCLTGRIETNEHTIAALFAADRLDHIFNAVNGIKQKLDDGVTVLCDRYYFSSLAYNGGFVPYEWVLSLNTPAMQALKADLTIFIDLPPEEGMRRISKRGAAERYETLDKQKKIRDRYFALFDKLGAGENISVIQSKENKEETQADIRALIDGLFAF